MGCQIKKHKDRLEGYSLFVEFVRDGLDAEKYHLEELNFSVGGGGRLVGSWREGRYLYHAYRLTDLDVSKEEELLGLLKACNDEQLGKAFRDLEEWQQRLKSSPDSEHAKGRVEFHQAVVDKFLRWYDTHGLKAPIDAYGVPHKTRRRRATKMEMDELYPKIADRVQDVRDEGTTSSLREVYVRVSKESEAAFGQHFTPGQLKGIYERQVKKHPRNYR